MEAKIFIKSVHRLCNYYSEDREKNCPACPLYSGKIGHGCYWFDISNYDVQKSEEIIDIVEKWVKEHPSKTRQDEFMEKYAGVAINEAGFCVILPCYIDKDEYGEQNCCGDCYECGRKYWLEETE